MSRGSRDGDAADHPIRLLVVEPRALLGEAVRELLDREPDIDVVGAVRSADEALPSLEETPPDVILVAGSSAQPAAREAARRLRRRAPRSHVVVLSDESNDASLVDAVQIGADARVAEVAEADQLVGTIRQVADGQQPLREELKARPDLLDQVLDTIHEGVLGEGSTSNPLSEREQEVLGLVATGLRNKEVADRLGLSSQTVKNHLSAILRKLGAPNRTRAVTEAARQGWLVIGEESPSG